VPQAVMSTVLCLCGREFLCLAANVLITLLPFVQVLMGFLGEEMTQSMLPLMINFEAKSITQQFPALKETMERR
jgi:hypothetical protein